MRVEGRAGQGTDNQDLATSLPTHPAHFSSQSDVPEGGPNAWWIRTRPSGESGEHLSPDMDPRAPLFPSCVSARGHRLCPAVLPITGPFLGLTKCQLRHTEMALLSSCIPAPVWGPVPDTPSPPLFLHWHKYTQEGTRRLIF